VLAFPVIIMLIFGSIYSVNNAQYDLAVQNKDGSAISAAFINAVNSTGAFKVHMANAGDNADAYIKSNQIGAMLIVPKGFGDQVKSNVAVGATAPAAVQVNPASTGKLSANVSALNTTSFSSQTSQTPSNNTNVTPAAVILKVDQSSTTSPVISGVMASIASSYNSRLTGSKQVVGVENQQVLSSQFNFVDFFVPGILGLTALTTGVLGTVGTNTQYRNSGILRKLATTPLKKSEWLISTMLYQSVVIFISAALIIFVAKLVFNVTTVPNAVTLLLLFAGAICFTGIGMIIARFVKDEDAANAAAMAITLPMLFLAGTFIPLEIMPDYLQTVAKLLPLTYLNYGLRDAMILGDTASALYNLSIVLVTGAVFFIIGSFITDWRESG
jgi:ABC-2 type transport system permease protein